LFTETIQEQKRTHGIGRNSRDHGFNQSSFTNL